MGKIEEAWKGIEKEKERTICKYCGEEIGNDYNSWADGFPGGWCTSKDGMVSPWCPNAPDEREQHEPLDESEPEQEIRDKNQSVPDEAYFDRNQAAMVIGKCAQMLGYPVGLKLDKDWSILYVSLPTGQVSWHIPSVELTGNFTQFTGEWDGHDVFQKRERLRKFIAEVK